MIDITVEEEEVTVEGKRFFLHSQDSIVSLIKEVLDKAKYSGESISLWKTEGEYKNRIEDW